MLAAAWRTPTGGSAADEFGKRFGEQPRGVCTRVKPGAPRDKGFRRGGQRAHRVWLGEEFWTWEACSPQVALDVDAGLQSVGWQPSLDDDLASIGLFLGRTARPRRLAG
jgi:hypothetical protein